MTTASSIVEFPPVPLDPLEPVQVADQVTSSRRRLAINCISLIGSSVLMRVINLVMNIYAPRVLGVTAMGQVGWSAAIISYFTLLVNPGLDVVAKREVASDPRRTMAILPLVATLQLVLAFGVMMIVAGIYLSGWRGPQVGTILAIQSIALLLTPFNFTWLLHAHERMAKVALAENLIQALQIPAMLLFVKTPADVLWFVLLPFPFRIALLGFVLWNINHHALIDWKNFRPTLLGMGEIIKSGAPIGLSQASILLYYNSDAIMLGLYHGDRAVGIYSVGYNLMMGPLAVSTALWMAFFPLLSRVADSIEDSRNLSQRFLQLMAWIGLPIGLLGWACGRQACELLYGPAFAETAQYFSLLCLNIPMVFINVALLMPLVSWRHERTVFVITALAAVSNVLANLWAISRFGIAGAVATTLGSEWLVFCCTIFIRQRVVKINLLREIWQPLTASVLAAVVTRLLVAQFGYWIFFTAVSAAVLISIAVLREPILKEKLFKRFRGGTSSAN